MPTIRPPEVWRPLVQALQAELRPGDELRTIFEPGGYWNVINDNLPPNPRQAFLLFQDDTQIQSGFLEIARKSWAYYYPDGVGLVALSDGVVDHGGACYAMTSKIWLYVLFGRPRFPPFWHHFLDTLLADRSKDLGRYLFVREAVCKHLHHSQGLSQWDGVYAATFGYGYDDFGMKNEMDQHWYHDGDRECAMQRMVKVSRETKAIRIPPPSEPRPPKPNVKNWNDGIGQWLGTHPPYRQSVDQAKQSGRRRRG